MIYERSVNEKKENDKEEREERRRNCGRGGPEAEERWDRGGEVGTGERKHTRNPKVAV